MSATLYVILGMSIASSIITVALGILMFLILCKKVKEIEDRCLDVINEAKENLKTASNINQALAMKVEIIEDAVKSLDFYRSQGKK
jgi:hypothetical protein